MNTLNAENSLVLVIDVQEKLVPATFNDNVAEKTAKLAKAANILEIPTVVTEQYPKGLGSTVEKVSQNFAADVQVREKTSFNALLEEGMLDLIKSYNKKQIVICGIETHICVHQTASALLQEGFDVYIVKDACGSRKESEFLAGLERMKENGAHISTLEITLFEWLKGAKNSNFKEIQSLIK